MHTHFHPGIPNFIQLEWLDEGLNNLYVDAPLTGSPEDANWTPSRGRPHDGLTDCGMVRFHAGFSTAMVPPITRSSSSPGRLALEISKATGVHVTECGEHPVDCEWLYTSVDSWDSFS
jgi:hypothetical protein